MFIQLSTKPHLKNTLIVVFLNLVFFGFVLFTILSGEIRWGLIAFCAICMVLALLYAVIVFCSPASIVLRDLDIEVSTKKVKRTYKYSEVVKLEEDIFGTGFRIFFQDGFSFHVTKALKPINVDSDIIERLEKLDTTQSYKCVVLLENLLKERIYDVEKVKI
ncbi:hypothetical protein ACLWBD_15455 [Bdellovibrio sp. HCB117]|uniref:hypothetical protein n=1 Tax=Bdellovibrio sp. HCB117 TaxID=3394359 RepID=UPI0039B3EF73